MCAINGFNFLDRALIARMNAVNRHRGPDASGIFSEDGISLGHNRLSIIDLSEKAGQPMKSFDEAEVMVFNGEIYNFKELKSELGGSYPFKSESDTEVILAAFRKWGPDCVKKFNGIFVFAIWDRAKREIFLARDHLGVKPLYYYIKDGKFIFSSEIKSILEHAISRRLNLEAFNHYLRVLYVPEPLTMFEDIYKFPQASRGFYKNGELKIEKYWEIEPDNYLRASKARIGEELRNKIQQAVKSQLISDRPLGLYLSGGLDSSILLYNMAQERGKIDTFSVGFSLKEEEQKEKFNADFNLAKKTASFFGTNHNEVIIGPGEVWDFLERSVWQMDEPISNPTASAMLKLSGFAKNKVDVVLAGDGGDELFGGYERYRLSRIATLFQKIPGFLRAPFNLNRKFKKLNTPAGVERFALFMFQKNDILKKVVSSDYFNRDVSKSFFERRYFGQPSETSDSDFKTVFSGNFEETLMNVDRRTWLTDFALMLTDKMSMANGLETRVPFLDKNIVEFAARIPLQYKIDLFNTKKILKNAYRGRIPDYLLNQPKRGWFSPGAKWLRADEFRNRAEEALSPGYYPATKALFDWRDIKQILENHISGKEYNLNILWAILTFQLWAKRFNIHI
ncbi:MAG: asparagine synthase (glutamine-hydrolyzing) [Candidatus Niyogibacteria bacterium]|nr:MAG: asparagine synthase (glutamine-hydrolyzing) [Candidatus Niyogibacteria bacterium]